MNQLEDLTARLNADIFYREFSFSKNAFLPTPGEKKEFADHVVWIDDLMVVYQLKQRGEIENATEDTERKWFQNKINKKAIKQVKDTLTYLQSYSDIKIQNQRGKSFNINSQKLEHIVKLVLYSANKMLPKDCQQKRHYISSTAGFIHIMRWADYLGVCSVLVTPAELIEYFEFREALICKWSDEKRLPSEPAFVGQFLYSDATVKPNRDFAKHLKTFKGDYTDFDISGVLAGIGDRIEYSYGDDGETDYYQILAEFAKLNRDELAEVKKRFMLCLDAVRKDEFIEPTRIVCPRTGCGFVFVPVMREMFEVRIQGLKNLMYAAKYDQKLDRQAGVSFASREDEVLIDWGFIEGKWEFDAELVAMLKDNNPFRPLRQEVRSRYYFEQ